MWNYTQRERIRKFFFEKHFDFLTSVPQQRLQEMILSSCMKGYSGKMLDYGECGPAYRTTYGHFLAKGKWNDKRMAEMQKRKSFQKVSELSPEMEHLFLSASTIQSCPKQCHLQRRNDQHRGLDGMTPIWRRMLYTSIRSIPPLLEPEMPRCTTP